MGGRIPRLLMRRAGWDVTVEPHAGAGPWGDTYGPAVPVRVLMDARRRLVRDQDGNEVTSETTLYVQLDDITSADGTPFNVGARVSLPDGTAPTVLTTSRHDGRSLPTPNHLEISLT